MRLWMSWRKKSSFLPNFYKQNEIACILWFGALGGLEDALRQACFVSCFKTPAGIKILPGNIIFLRSSPYGVTILLLGWARPRSRPRHVFLESRKHKQNKGKSIKMISLWPLKTRKYWKSAQDYKQNWITQNRSTWPVAAHPQMTIYDRFNFCFKSQAGIKIIIF